MLSPLNSQRSYTSAYSLAISIKYLTYTQWYPTTCLSKGVLKYVLTRLTHKIKSGEFHVR